MVQRQDIPSPGNDEEYTIHALNIHGTFFERKCQSIVHRAKAWEIQETNYPVTYGGANSNLDIWAEGGKHTHERLILPIECKKIIQILSIGYFSVNQAIGLLSLTCK